MKLSVGENRPAGAVVGSIAAYDADQAGPIFYYIQGNYFSICLSCCTFFLYDLLMCMFVHRVVCLDYCMSLFPSVALLTTAVFLNEWLSKRLCICLAAVLSIPLSNYLSVSHLRGCLISFLQFF